jgi:hypothetical protein
MFLIFFGVIITVQIIPGLMLFGVMLKEVCGFGRKAVSFFTSIHPLGFQTHSPRHGVLNWFVNVS